MTKLEKLHARQRQGFFLFPIQENTKDKPLVKWRKESSNDPKAIEFWNKKWPKANWGLDTSKHASGKHLLFADIDYRNGGDTNMEVDLLPKSFCQSTPNGRHHGYLTDLPLKTGTSTIAPGIDTRALGGYVVIDPSVINGKAYVADDVPLAKCPEWIEKKVGTAKLTEKDLSAKGVEILKSLKPADQGNRNHAAYVAANILKDQDIPEALCYHLMVEHFNATPALENDEILHVVTSAYKYGQTEQGSGTAEAMFESVEIPTGASDVEKSYLEKINDEYALIYMEGTHAILHETIDEKGRRRRAFLDERTFKRRFSPKNVQAAAKGKPLTEAEVWLDWKARREYTGLCFTPGREPRNGYYNLWRGFTHKPVAYAEATADAKRGFDIYVGHVKENACGNDAFLFQWFMQYFAHLVQKPYERPLTTLVFKGGKGTGKNVIFNPIGNLLGAGHYLVATDNRYFLSNFNGHMDSCLLMILDEAFWSGDKSANGKIKGLTTSPEILIERKGKEPYVVDNLLRLVILGNEDWLVPASEDERRYAVFQMGDARKQDTEYFQEMMDLLTNKGGCAVLLDHLQKIDISKFDIAIAPRTEALLEQKIRSLTPLRAYIYDSLRDGVFQHQDFDLESWTERMPKIRFKAAFLAYCNERKINMSYRDMDQFVAADLRKIFPDFDNRARANDDGKRKSAYAFPPLDMARKQFNKFIGHEVKW